MAILNGGGTNMAEVTLRCTKDGTNYDYVGTDTQPSSGKYLKYTNGSKTGYLYLNPADKGYIATLSNNKKLRVNGYYVEESVPISEPIYTFVHLRFTTWASKDSDYDDGYINKVKPGMITGNLWDDPHFAWVDNRKPLVNLYHPAANSITMDVIFNMPYGATTTKSFNINCRKESNGSISPDAYYLPTTVQVYRPSNEHYDCYYGEGNSATYPALYHRGIYFERRECATARNFWYRTAEG